MAAHSARGGARILGFAESKRLLAEASRAQKSSYTVRIQSHLVLACLRSLTSPSPRITGPNFALSLSLSLGRSLCLFSTLVLFIADSLEKSYPRHVVDHYRQTFRVVSAVQMQRNRENGDRRFRMVVLDVWRRFLSGRFRRTTAFLFQLLENFLLLIGAGKLRVLSLF